MEGKCNRGKGGGEPTRDSKEKGEGKSAATIEFDNPQPLWGCSGGFAANLADISSCC